MNNIQIKVGYYEGARGDPEPPDNYRVEITIGNHTFVPDLSKSPIGYSMYRCGPYTTKENANQIAVEIARELGLEAKLAQE
ncbi:MAG: hypothetical protein AABX10_00390 [Nanoarchaeota archaeon]